MKYRRRLFSTADPFDTNTTDLFVKAVKENCKYHYDNCPEYKKILDGLNFKPDSINSYEDIQTMPFIPTLFFKNHNIYSMPSCKMIKASSSGTKGKFSNIGFDISGLLCGLKMVLKIGSWRKLFSLMPAITSFSVISPT